MKQKFTTSEGQNILDLVLTLEGSIEGLPAFLERNLHINPNGIVQAGTEVILDTENQERAEVVNYLSSRNIRVNTGDIEIPSPPSGLSAIPTLNEIGSITLNWSDNSQGLYAFEVWRRKKGALDFLLVYESEIGETTWQNDNLDHGTTYEYKVRVKGFAGAVEFSNIAEATTPNADLEIRNTNSSKLVATGTNFVWDHRAGISYLFALSGKDKINSISACDAGVNGVIDLGSNDWLNLVYICFKNALNPDIRLGSWVNQTGVTLDVENAFYEPTDFERMLGEIERVNDPDNVILDRTFNAGIVLVDLDDNPTLQTRIDALTALGWTIKIVNYKLLSATIGERTYVSFDNRVTANSGAELWFCNGQRIVGGVQLKQGDLVELYHSNYNTVELISLTYFSLGQFEMESILINSSIKIDLIGNDNTFDLENIHGFDKITTGGCQIKLLSKKGRDNTFEDWDFLEDMAMNQNVRITYPRIILQHYNEKSKVGAQESITYNNVGYNSFDTDIHFNEGEALYYLMSCWKACRYVRWGNQANIGNEWEIDYYGLMAVNSISGFEQTGSVIRQISKLIYLNRNSPNGKTKFPASIGGFLGQQSNNYILHCGYGGHIGSPDKVRTDLTGADDEILDLSDWNIEASADFGYQYRSTGMLISGIIKPIDGTKLKGLWLNSLERRKNITDGNIDLANQTALEVFYLYSNYYSRGNHMIEGTLDFSGCTSLNFIQVGRVNEMNVSGCSSLTRFSGQSNYSSAYRFGVHKCDFSSTSLENYEPYYIDNPQYQFGTEDGLSLDIRFNTATLKKVSIWTTINYRGKNTCIINDGFYDDVLNSPNLEYLRLAYSNAESNLGDRESRVTFQTHSVYDLIIAIRDKGNFFTAATKTLVFTTKMIDATLKTELEAFGWSVIQ